MRTLTTRDNGERLLITDNGQPWPAPDPAKPPYRVPLVAETRAAPRNGLRVVSTFAGGGGSSYGYELEGYTVLWANEVVPAALDTYRANHPGTILDGRDIRTVRPADILGACGLEPGELDVLDGSPPCQPFSTAGKLDRGWGKVNAYGDGTTQKGEDLFWEYARLVEGLQPRVFVAENVSGLVRGKAKGYFKLILARLQACGYRVRARVLDAQWLGVPQMRQRVVFVGVRNDLDAEPVFPAPLPYRYSVREALPHLLGYRYDNSGWHAYDDQLNDPARTVAISGGAAPLHHKVTGPVPRIYAKQRFGGGIEEVSADEPAPTVMAKGMRGVREHQIGVAPPGEGQLNYPGLPEEPRIYAKAYGDMGVTEVPIDAPAPTVMAKGMGGVREYQIGIAPRGEGRTNYGQGDPPTEHPLEPRKFTIAEVRRLCGFPDDYVLTGSYLEQWARLGNAVPPPMIAAVAREVRDRILLPA